MSPEAESICWGGGGQGGHKITRRTGGGKVGGCCGCGLQWHFEFRRVPIPHEEQGLLQGEQQH